MHEGLPMQGAGPDYLPISQNKEEGLLTAELQQRVESGTQTP